MLLNTVGFVKMQLQLYMTNSEQQANLELSKLSQTICFLFRYQH